MPGVALVILILALAVLVPVYFAFLIMPRRI